MNLNPLRTLHAEQGSMQILTIFFIVTVAITFVPMMLALSDIVNQRAQMTLVAQQSAYAGATVTDPDSTEVRILPERAAARAAEVMRANLGPNSEFVASGGSNAKYEAWLRVHNPWVSFRSSRVWNPTCDPKRDEGQYSGQLVSDIPNGRKGYFTTAQESRISCWLDNSVSQPGTIYDNYEAQQGLTGAYKRSSGIAVEIKSALDLCLVPMMDIVTDGACDSTIYLTSHGYSDYTFENVSNPEPYLVLGFPGAVTSTSTDFTWQIFDWADAIIGNPPTTVICQLSRLNNTNNVWAPIQIDQSRCNMDNAVDGSIALDENDIGIPGRYRFRVGTTLTVSGPGGNSTKTYWSDTHEWIVNPNYNDLDIALDGEYVAPEGAGNDSVAIQWTATGSRIASATCTLTIDQPTPLPWIPVPRPALFGPIPVGSQTVPCADTSAGAVADNQIEATFSRSGLVPYAKYTYTVVVKNQGGGQVTDSFTWDTAPPKHRWDLSVTPTEAAWDNGSDRWRVSFEVKVDDNWGNFTNAVNTTDNDENFCRLEQWKIEGGNSWVTVPGTRRNQCMTAPTRTISYPNIPGQYILPGGYLYRLRVEIGERGNYNGVDLPDTPLRVVSLNNAVAAPAIANVDIDLLKTSTGVRVTSRFVNSLGAALTNIDFDETKMGMDCIAQGKRIWNPPPNPPNAIVVNEFNNISLGSPSCGSKAGSTWIKNIRSGLNQPLAGWGSGSWCYWYKFRGDIKTRVSGRWYSSGSVNTTESLQPSNVQPPSGLQGTNRTAQCNGAPSNS
jgi:hypothetical protein